MKILFASGNEHKIEEVRAIAAAANCPFDLVGLKDLDLADAQEPEENGRTFEENAIIKARYYAALSGLPTLADDSGLEVDALGGEPGVLSARYAGVQGSRSEVDAANNCKLMSALAGLPPESLSARFRAVVALVLSESGIVLATTEGVFEGRILTLHECDDPTRPHQGRGENGFGYDPLFMLGNGCTSAQLPAAEKNAVSHRGQAVRAMIQRIQALHEVGEL